MILNISKNELLNAITCVEKAIRKSTMPIMETIFIQSTGTELIFEATNLELGIRTSVSCIAETGSICINAKQLTDIVKKMPDTNISIETNDSFAVTLIANKKIKFTIPGDNPATFPHFKEDEGDFLTICGEDLKEAIKGVAFCAAVEETNKMMTGINVVINGTQAIFSALDGHRIAVRIITLSTAANKDFNITIPADYLKEIVKILPSDDIEMIIAEERVLFKTESTLITSRLLDGTYFDVSKIYSTSYKTEVVVNRTNLLASVDRSNLIISNNDKRPVKFDIKDQNIKVYCNSNVGKAEEDVEVVSKSGDDMKIGFNPKFVMDMLQAVSDDEISLRLLNNKTPLLVTNKQDTYKYVILPVNFVEQEDK